MRDDERYFGPTYSGYDEFLKVNPHLRPKPRRWRIIFGWTIMVVTMIVFRRLYVPRILRENV
jgi:hypothetical protein